MDYLPDQGHFFPSPPSPGGGVGVGLLKKIPLGLAGCPGRGGHPVDPVSRRVTDKTMTATTEKTELGLWVESRPIDNKRTKKGEVKRTPSQHEYLVTTIWNKLLREQGVTV